MTNYVFDRSNIFQYTLGDTFVITRKTNQKSIKRLNSYIKPIIWAPDTLANCDLVLGRYRFLMSVSVFGIFFRFFQKSVRFSVSVFQNIAISVRFFGFIYLYANLHVGAQLIRYCTSEVHVHYL